VTSSSKHLTQTAAQNARLDRGTESDGLVGILRGVRLTAEEFAHIISHQRHAGAAADEDDFVEVCRFDACIAQSAQAVQPCAFDPRPGDFFEIGAGDVEAVEGGRFIAGEAFFDRFSSFKHTDVIAAADSAVRR
jgi:hypothetical protein